MFETLPTPIERHLAARIGLICHVARLAVLVYALWLGAAVLSFCFDEVALARVYGAVGTAVSPGQQAIALGITGTVYVFVCLACYGIWRLLAEYLSGRVFRVEAATWMRRAALFGLLALVADVAARPMLSWTVRGFAGTGWMNSLRIWPTDLLLAVVLISVLALALILHAAAEIAEEHAGFV